MTRQEVYDRIITVSHDTVKSRHCYFDAEAEKQLSELVWNAVYNTMSFADINNPLQVARAENNMRDLCNKLCDRARNENKLIVENRVFSAARFSLCPIWPFC